MPHKHINSNGYVLMISVLVLGAVGLITVLSLVILGVSHTQSALVIQQSAQAEFLAESCIEAGLEQIRESAAYAGSNSLIIGADSCAYSVLNLGGDLRQVDATGTVSQAVKKIQVTTSALKPKIIISSWQRVGGF